MSMNQPPAEPAPAPPPGWGPAASYYSVDGRAPAPLPPAPSPRSGLAVTSLVLAAAALLGVLGIIAWLAAAGGSAGAPLTGQVAVRSGTLPGGDLAAAVQQRIRDDGGNPWRISCPDTAAVSQNVTTVCHGRIDGEDWAIIVFFEDTSGSYTLLPV